MITLLGVNLHYIFFLIFLFIYQPGARSAEKKKKQIKKNPSNRGVFFRVVIVTF